MACPHATSHLRRHPIAMFLQDTTLSTRHPAPRPGERTGRVVRNAEHKPGRGLRDSSAHDDGVAKTVCTDPQGQLSALGGLRHGLRRDVALFTLSTCMREGPSPTSGTAKADNCDNWLVSLAGVEDHARHRAAPDRDRHRQRAVSQLRVVVLAAVAAAPWLAVDGVAWAAPNTCPRLDTAVSTRPTRDRSRWSRGEHSSKTPDSCACDTASMPKAGMTPAAAPSAAAAPRGGPAAPAVLGAAGEVAAGPRWRSRGRHCSPTPG